MSTVSSSKPLLARFGAAFGYGSWTVIGSFLAPAFVLYGILREAVRLGWLDASQFERPESMTILFAAQYLLGLAILLSLPVFIQKWRPDKLREIFGLVRAPKWSDFGWALLAFAGYMAATIAVLTVVKLLVPGLDLEETQDVGFKNLTDTTGLIAAFFALVVVAPVAEELIFRGYLFGTLSTLTKLSTAVIVTSVVFGAVHGQWNVGIDVAVLSVFLCLLRVHTGSVWGGIFLHMTKNALAYFLLFVAPLLGMRIQ